MTRGKCIEINIVSYQHGQQAHCLLRRMQFFDFDINMTKKEKQKGKYQQQKSTLNEYFGWAEINRLNASNKNALYAPQNWI